MTTTQRTAAPAETESLIVISDVHLGCDVDRTTDPHRISARPDEVDEDLTALIDWYAANAPAQRTWRLVIDGDLVDFLRMRVDVSIGAIETPPNEEERAHGLGSASDHAAIKLDAVADRHENVFEALGRFVAGGHAVTIIRGNHDVDLHWPAVQERMRERILRGAASSTDARERVAFSDWFFYREGLVFIEHGQQYDDFCSSSAILAPLAPGDTQRTQPGLCDILNRYVVRPSKGLWEYGHEGRGVLAFLWYGATIGPIEGVRVFVRFARAVRALFGLRASEVSEGAKAVRDTHDGRVRDLAMRHGWSEDRLRALAALHAPPITSTYFGVLSCTLLDRLLLAALLGPLSLISTFFGFWSTKYMIAGLFGIVVWLFAHRALTKLRKRDTSSTLEERAREVATIAEVPFVVMGHTHRPIRAPLAGVDATYLNVGSWSEESLMNGRTLERATRTHVVIDGVEKTAELREWVRGATATDGAPRLFVADGAA